MTVLAFTRPERRLAESVALAESMGFGVLTAPSADISHGDADDYLRIRHLLEKKAFGIAVFSSVTAAEECGKEWGNGMKDLFGEVHVVPIGAVTGAYLSGLGMTVRDAPEEYSSSGLVSCITERYGRGRVLLIRSDRGSDILTKGLTAAGMDVDELVSYRLTENTHDLRIKKMIEKGLAGGIDVFAFTSPMAVASLAEASGGRFREVMKGAKVAAIGRPTSAMLMNYGITADIMPERATFGELLKKIAERESGKK